MAVFATEMSYLDDKRSDFEHGVLFLDLQMVKIHYHLKCQDITDNVSDNKLWMIQSIQTVVYAAEISHIDSKRWDLIHVVLSLDLRKGKYSLSPQMSGYYRQLKW